MRKSLDASPKIVAVYEAVNRLICDGQDVTSLIVADIAREAGIGKGTIYEYFESKEEIIARALFYQLDMIMVEISNALTQADTVEDCFMMLADMMNEGNRLGTFFELGKTLVSDAPAVAQKLQDWEQIGELSQKYIECIVDIFRTKLEREGLIQQETDREYVHFLVLGLLQMVMTPGYMPDKRKKMVAYSMKTLKKALM